MARFSIHPDSFGDYNHLREFVLDRCPTALFDSDEQVDEPMTAIVWVSDDEVEAAKEALKELGCTFEPADV